MGFFSQDCKICGHSVLCHNATDKEINAWMSQAVVYFANGDRVSGEYDGYGCVGGMDGAIGMRGATVYHRACWEHGGKPTYDGPSPSSDDQGWFFDDGDHDMLEPGIEHPPGALEAAQAARKARREQSQRLQAIDMLRDVEEWEEDPIWQRRYNVTHWKALDKSSVHDRLTGEYRDDFKSPEEARRYAETSWAAFWAERDERRAWYGEWRAAYWEKLSPEDAAELRETLVEIGDPFLEAFDKARAHPNS